MGATKTSYETKKAKWTGMRPQCHWSSSGSPTPTIFSRPSARVEHAPYSGLSLGVKVVETGASVTFLWLDELLYALKKDTGTLLYRLRRKNYVNFALPILDEAGL